MRRVLWADSARDDLWDIVRHIAADDPDAAEKVANTIDRTASKLADYATGHPGRVTGTYEKTVTGYPYILAYSLIRDGTAEVIAILHVIHGARNWNPEEWPD